MIQKIQKGTSWLLWTVFTVHIYYLPTLVWSFRQHLSAWIRQIHCTSRSESTLFRNANLYLFKLMGSYIKGFSVKVIYYTGCLPQKMCPQFVWIANSASLRHIGHVCWPWFSLIGRGSLVLVSVWVPWPCCSVNLWLFTSVLVACTFSSLSGWMTWFWLLQNTCIWIESTCRGILTHLHQLTLKKRLWQMNK